MAVIAQKHRKLEDGSYLLAVEDDGEVHDFVWPPCPEGVIASEYEEMQLREAALLVTSAKKGSEGTPLASEGKQL